MPKQDKEGGTFVLPSRDNKRETRFFFVDVNKNRIGFPDCCLLKIYQNLVLAIFFTCL